MALSSSAWAFFSATDVALLGLLGQAFTTRRKINTTASDAKDAADKAQTAVDNTNNISNGFAGGVIKKLDRVQDVLTTHTGMLAEQQKTLNRHTTQLEELSK